MTASAPSPGELPAPGLGRRMACFVYEGVLLFGVLMVTGLLYALATRQQHALVGTGGLQALLFVVIGLYFVVFWSRTGQTLAMQTWQVRLVTRQGAPVPGLQAVARYLLSWLWFLPALAVLWWSGLKEIAPAVMAVAAGVLTYAGLTWLHPQRQFLHDTLCGTRLITCPRPPRT